MNMSKNTIIDLLERSYKLYSDNVMLLEKEGDTFQPTTYSQAYDRVLNIGAGLSSLGVAKGDKISILAEGCNDWIISELGLLYAGAVSVPLSVKLSESSDLIFRLEHAEVSIVMVSSSQLAKIEQLRDQLPMLKHIILFGSDSRDGVISLKEIEAMGEEYLKEHREEFMAIGREIENSDYATITYTSGTTSDPKGVILTHRNYTANVEQALTCMDIPPSYSTLIILPLDHCFAHVVGFYIMIYSGASIATVQVGQTAMETLKNIPINIREIQPDYLLSVPALAKNFKSNIENSIKAKGKTTERLFNFALKVSYLYNGDGYKSGKGLKITLKPIVRLMDNILYSKIREGFGGNLKFFVGGGALLDSEFQRFFCAIGMPMLQGYGLSEATPVISTNTLERKRFGSSGVLVSPLEVKILDEDGNTLNDGFKGEIVIRGENVMAGYWKNQASTLEVIKDGWLHTGDMGYLGKDGLLYVLGRFKSLLIASDGEKYSPEGMEASFAEQSKYIDQVILHNNQSPYTVALIVPSMAALKGDGKSQEQLADYAIEVISKELAQYKSGGKYGDMFPQRWLPSTFALLPEPFTESNGMVNSTMKVIRGKVESHYGSMIEYMYTPQGRNVYNDNNRGSINRNI